MPGQIPYRPPAWPTETERLCLQAALLEDDRAVEAWATIGGAAGEVAWREGEILPLAFFNLQRLGVPMPDMPRAAHAFNRTAVANDANLLAGGRVLGLLADAGIGTLLLKGAALLLVAYPHRGTRWMFDFDVLVRLSDVPAATSVLARAGYEAAEADPRDSMGVRAGGQFLDRQGHDVDLHWHALGNFLSTDVDRWFWDGSIPADLSGSPTRVLAPADQLCHVVAHGVRTSYPPLRRLTDAALIIRSAVGNVDWERLAWMCARLEITLHMRDVLRYLEARVEIHVPGEAFRALARSDPATSERWRHAVVATLHPDSVIAALVRGWDTYAFARRATGRRVSPLAFPRFMWRLVGSRSETVPAALRRKLGGALTRVATRRPRH